MTFNENSKISNQTEIVYLQTVCINLIERMCNDKYQYTRPHLLLKLFMATFSFSNVIIKKSSVGYFCLTFIRSLVSRSKDVQDEKDICILYCVICSQLLLLGFPEVVSMNTFLNDAINIFRCNRLKSSFYA